MTSIGFATHIECPKCRGNDTAYCWIDAFRIAGGPHMRIWCRTCGYQWKAKSLPQTSAERHSREVIGEIRNWLTHEIMHLNRDRKTNSKAEATCLSRVLTKLNKLADADGSQEVSE